MRKRIILLMLVVIIATGCSNSELEQAKNGKQGEQTAINEDQSKGKEEAELESVDPKDKIDLSVKPNEAGKIMVLMYHNIGSEEQEWVRTPENFRKDLLTLYEKDYRPISLEDYVSGNITTPEGFTPVVLTFDDGNKNNFEYNEDNTIDKDSVISILLDFNKKYPDFNATATFFLTGDVPFGQSGQEAEKINFLLENGMSIGNHTRTHANFTQISKEKLQKEIGGQASYLEGFINKEDYKVDTLALPYGSRPNDDSLKKYLKTGSYEGSEYNNIAILNVGWNPAESPYSSSFDFESIPRIRASEMKVDNVGLYNYLEYFDNNPEERFISDGVPELVTVPKEKLELIKTDLEKEVYSYE